jgi:hypothetical protein
MDPLHASLAPMIAAWMGGALLSLASAGLRHRLGLRSRRLAAAPAFPRGHAPRRAAAAPR